jgi:divalent metal cation (Fe/Co/Zn/Cd) transporter
MSETVPQPPGTHVHANQGGDHPHAAPEHQPVISQRWKWMTVLGNAAIGTCELISGGFSTLAVTSDGLHNVGDTATYYMQSENILNPNLSERRRTRMRKLAHWAIAATSLGVSAKAGVDLGLNHESTPDPMTVYTAGASLAMNSLMLARLRQGRRKRTGHASVHEHDLAKHFWAVDIPSAALAFAGAILQKYNVEIEQVAAIASGAVGAYAFRPTRKNLAHNCLDHN